MTDTSRPSRWSPAPLAVLALRWQRHWPTRIMSLPWRALWVGWESLDDRIQQKGGSATLAPMDITKADAMAQLCRSVHDRWGQIALWVHTAIHAAPLTPVDHMDAKDWQKSLSINLDAMAHLVPYVSALLKKDGSAVLFGGHPRWRVVLWSCRDHRIGAESGLVTQLAGRKPCRFGRAVRIFPPRPMGKRLCAHACQPGEDRSVLARQSRTVVARSSRIESGAGMRRTRRDFPSTENAPPDANRRTRAARQGSAYVRDKRRQAAARTHDATMTGSTAPGLEGARGDRPRTGRDRW